MIDSGDMVDLGIWSIIETNVSVICICVITIKPVLERLFPSSMILKIRRGWSRLRSSRLRGTDIIDDSSGKDPSTPVAAPYGSSCQLAAALEDDSSSKEIMTARDHSFPLHFIGKGAKPDDVNIV